MLRTIAAVALAATGVVLLVLIVRQYRAGDQSGREVAVASIAAASSILGAVCVATWS